MGLFAYVKSGVGKVASALWTGVKRVVAPIVIPAGRAFTYSGQSLFYLLNFIKLVTNRPNHPAGIYAGIVAIICSLVVIIPTRGVAVWRYFRNSDKPKLPEPSAEHANIQSGGNDAIDLGKTGKGLYYSFSALSYDTTFFTLLNSYLNAMTLIEFLSAAVNKDAHSDDREFYTQAGALTLAVCAMITYYIYSVKKAVPNAKIAAHHIEHLSFPNNKYSVITTCVGVLGTAAIPFTNFFTTYSALGKVPWVKTWNNGVKFTISGISSLSFTVAHALTQIPPIYEFLTSRQQNYRYTHRARWETPLSIALYIAALGELIVFGLGNYNGIVKTSNDTFDISTTNLALILIAIPLASSTAFLNLFFSAHQGFQKMRMQYHQDRGEVAYEVKSDIENPMPSAPARTTEKSAATTSSPSKSVYQRPSSPTLFVKPVEEKKHSETSPLLPKKTDSHNTTPRLSLTDE